jgi:hypothetical protein
MSEGWGVLEAEVGPFTMGISANNEDNTALFHVTLTNPDEVNVKVSGKGIKRAENWKKIKHCIELSAYNTGEMSMLFEVADDLTKLAKEVRKEANRLKSYMKSRKEFYK